MPAFSKYISEYVCMFACKVSFLVLTAGEDIGEYDEMK
jgi:hypothetical protein